MWVSTFPTQCAGTGVQSVLVGLSGNLYMLSVRHMDELIHNNFSSIKLHVIAPITHILKMVAVCNHFF